MSRRLGGDGRDPSFVTKRATLAGLGRRCPGRIRPVVTNQFVGHVGLFPKQVSLGLEQRGLIAVKAGAFLVMPGGGVIHLGPGRPPLGGLLESRRVGVLGLFVEGSDLLDVLVGRAFAQLVHRLLGIIHRTARPLGVVRANLEAVVARAKRRSTAKPCGTTLVSGSRRCCLAGQLLARLLEWVLRIPLREATLTLR